MTRRPLKSTTAILAALSLLQPLPSFAQSSSDVSANDAVAQTGEQTPLRTPEEICAEVNITEELECSLHILELEAATADAEAETQAAAEAEKKEAEATAKAEAEAEALAVEEAQATADAEAEAQAAAEAEKKETEATAEAEAEALAVEEAQAAADAEAEAQAAAEAEKKEAESTAEAEAETLAVEEAQAAADAESEAQAAAEAEKKEAESTAEAEAESTAEAEAEAETETTMSATSADDTEACLAEVIASDGSVVCVDALTGDSIEALATETDADTSVDVTTETVTEQTQRSSSEEFREWSPEVQELSTTQQSVARKSKSKDGMSDLEKAGLLALGAVVVGAILLNGQRVEANTGDRVVVVDDDNDYRIFKDDDALLRQPGSEVRTQRFSDGSTRSNVMRSDGTEIITIRDSGGRVLRRVLVETDGRQYVLFDDTQSFEPVVIRDLPAPAFDDFDYQAASDRENLRLALLAADRRDIGRSFSLRQVREILEVRQLSPEINLRSITFATNSSAIQPSQAQQLRQMGMLMRDLIADDPTELFLIEGYTDAIGAPGYNLLLSDRRAESVALALNEYFDVPTENMVVQGYGERFLKIPTQEAERLNRRVAVRRITTLVRARGL